MELRKTWGRPPRPGTAGRAARTFTVWAGAAALSAGLLTVPATAAEAAAPPFSATPGSSERARDEARASEQARRSGEPVEVETARGEFVKTYANADGTFTEDRYLRPVHVRTGKGFVPVDNTLVLAKDGTVRPKAASTGMAFSGGGKKKPLATEVFSS